MKNGATWLERQIAESFGDIPEKFMDIHPSTRLAPFYMDVPENIPGNIPNLAGTLNKYVTYFYCCKSRLS